RIDVRSMSRLVHETLQGPVDPSRTDRAQPARAEGLIGEIVAQDANPVRSHTVPMVSAMAGERIEFDAMLVLEHEGRHHRGRRPAGGHVMLHCYDLTAFAERHAQTLY